MLPHHLPEKTSQDTRINNMALKYVAVAAIAICTIAVSALFVKVYILQAEPPLHNKVYSIEENQEPVHKKQDEVFVIDVNIEFEHPTTIASALIAKPCEPVNQESSEDKNNTLKQKLRKSHIFQSIIPGNVVTELTNVEIVNPIEESHKKNEDSNLNQNPFRELWDSFNFTDEKGQKINNEKRENDNNPLDNIFSILVKPIFDSNDTRLSVFKPIDDLFEPSETFLNFPSFESYFNSNEIFEPNNSLKETGNSSNFSEFYPDSQEERSESTTTNSNETRKHSSIVIE